MGKDTEPTVGNPSSSSFYTEGKVLGGFILAATEYERRFIDGGGTGVDERWMMDDGRCVRDGGQRYTLDGRLLNPQTSHKGVVIENGRKVVSNR